VAFKLGHYHLSRFSLRRKRLLHECVDDSVPKSRASRQFVPSRVPPHQFCPVRFFRPLPVRSTSASSVESERVGVRAICSLNSVLSRPNDQSPPNERSPRARSDKVADSATFSDERARNTRCEYVPSRVPSHRFGPVPLYPPLPVRWERVGVRWSNCFARPVPTIRSRPVPPCDRGIGSRISWVIFLSRIRDPTQPLVFLPSRNCRGSFRPIVKKDPHHRRGSFFVPAGDLFPARGADRWASSPVCTRTAQPRGSLRADAGCGQLAAWSTTYQN